ncbi:MAG: hypothetical protein JO091_02880 [Acidobacteriaceae bacterium]|nr:hypothetical protein [Acidobacteriaceae bacterium]
MRICSITVLFLAGVWTPYARAWTDATPRTIEIVADGDNRFKLPGQAKQVLVLKANEPVLLKITARRGQEMARDGAVHSLVVRNLRSEGWDVRLKEGEQEVRLRAPSHPGTYLIECTVRCGTGHDSMKLKMVVEP